MPIKSCTLSGGGKGYKFGDSGHCYADKGDAVKQMKAEYYNGYKGKASADVKAECEGLSEAEINSFIGDKEIPFMIRVAFSEVLKARKLGVPEKPANYNEPNALKSDDIAGEEKQSPTNDINSDGGSLGGPVVAEKKIEIPKDKKGKSQLPNAVAPY